MEPLPEKPLPVVVVRRLALHVEVAQRLMLSVRQSDTVKQNYNRFPKAPIWGSDAVIQ